MENLEKRYQTLPDSELERLAYYEAKDLTPEALNVLKSEMERRFPEQNLQGALEIQLQGLSVDEEKTLTRSISRLPCPYCSKKNDNLNASFIAIVKSALIVTTYEKPLIIGCTSCITAFAKNALLKSLLLGWWGIPWGPIRTIESVFTNIKAKDSNRYYEPTKEYMEFISLHSSAIKAKIHTIDNLNDLLDALYFA